MRRSAGQSARGMTLVELLVGMTLGLVAAAVLPVVRPEQRADG